MGNPVMSMDTKKKEHIGNLYRDGQLFTKETVLTFDHDFPSLAVFFRWACVKKFEKEDMIGCLLKAKRITDDPRESTSLKAHT
jgi:hypothetical protein